MNSVMSTSYHKGIPALARLLRVQETGGEGRLVRRVGGFSKPTQAIWEAPEALWQPHSVVARMRGKWVFPGRDYGCAEYGCFPGRE